MAERTRSNIPQQALVLLNDPTYVEAARVFAARILREGGADVEDAAALGLRAGSWRARPTREEMRILAALLEKHRAQYRRTRGGAEA